MTQIFENTEWSDFLWNDHQRFSDNARHAVHEGVKKIADKFEDFGNESFYRFYSKNPSKKSEPVVGSEWAEKLHKLAEDVPEFQNLKEHCQGSDWRSGLANEALLEELLTKVTPPEKPFEDVEQYQSAQEMLKSLLEDGGLSEEETETVQKQIEDLEEAIQGKADNAKTLADMLDDTEVRTALRASSAKASEAIQNVENTLDGLGCGGGAHSGQRGNSGSVKDILPLVRDSKTLNEIMKLAGRLKRLAKQKQKAKPKQGTNEYTGVLQGDDLARMLPVEGSLLMDPDMEVVFGRKMMEKALLQYELKEKPEENQGPIVMLLDSSGSMQGTRQQWAAAVALAFLGIAQDQKRAFSLVYFGSSVLKTFEFAMKAPLDPLEMIEAATYFASAGGTEFEPPLTEGLRILKDSKNFEKADIIMVTDGEARVSDAFLNTWAKAKEAAEFSCYSILIGEDSSKVLGKFSDEVVVLKDVMRDEAKMHELFGRV